MPEPLPLPADPNAPQQNEGGLPADLDAMLGLDQPQPAPSPTAPAEPAPPAEQAPQQSGWSLEKFLEQKIPDAPEFLADDAKQLDSWKATKGLLKNALTENQALQMQLEQAGGPAMPESDAVKAVQAQLEEIQNDDTYKAFSESRSEFERWKAAQGIEGEPSFQEAFDAKRASLLESIEGIAREAGLADDTVKGLLRKETEFTVAKYLADNVEDTTARDLLRNKAVEFARLTAERKSALSADDPASALREWQKKTESMRGQQIGQNVQAQQGALVAKLTDLSASLSQDDPFFRTAAGQKSVSELTNRITKGGVPSTDDIAEMALRAESAGAYRIYASSLAEQNATMRKQLAAMGYSPAAEAPTNPVSRTPAPHEVSPVFDGLASRTPFEIPR